MPPGFWEAPSWSGVHRRTLLSFQAISLFWGQQVKIRDVWYFRSGHRLVQDPRTHVYSVQTSFVVGVTFFVGHRCACWTWYHRDFTSSHIPGSVELNFAWYLWVQQGVVWNCAWTLQIQGRRYATQKNYQICITALRQFGDYGYGCRTFWTQVSKTPIHRIRIYVSLDTWQIVVRHHCRKIWSASQATSKNSETCVTRLRLWM